MYDVIPPNPSLLTDAGPWKHPGSCSQLPEEIIKQFHPLSLEDLGGAVLMNRQETKFLVNHNQLPRLLSGLLGQYRILDMQGRRKFRYRSIYLDTADHLFFQQHHRGVWPRWKIRQRYYVDSGLSFLEIKIKDNHRKTKKTRREIIGTIGEALEKIPIGDLPLALDLLHESLETRYSRITLVHNTINERVTIDFGLGFFGTQLTYWLSGWVIVEIKQGSQAHRSEAIQGLKSIGARPTGFSKYCLGCILMNPALKHNRFLPVLRKVESFIVKGEANEWSL
jgi:hypothetical protein